MTLAVVIGVGGLFISGASAQYPDPFKEMQRRAQEQLARERLERFIQDTYEFFEISGELVSFRVRPDMTEEELETLDQQARDLEDQAERLSSFILNVAPYVRGETEDLWIIFDPPDESSTLEERLTLILALCNRLSPKLDQIALLVSGELDPTVSVEDLQLELSAPYFAVGGLDELRFLTQELRSAL